MEWCAHATVEVGVSPKITCRRTKYSLPSWRQGIFPIILINPAGTPCVLTYSHVHTIADFISANRTKVNKHIHCLAERTKQWEDRWGDKVKQYQVPIFTGTTRAEWALSFDVAIADALELGALRREAARLTPEQIAYIKSIQPFGVPLNVLTTIAEYYIANKPYDSDWCVLPVSNIEAFLGSAALGKQYMTKIPVAFMEKKETSYGISVCKIRI